jgi:hypothetical protein
MMMTDNTEVRPTCQEPGCDRPCHLNSTHKKTGRKIWRKLCGKCHGDKIAAKHGLKNLSQVIAKNAGFENHRALELHRIKERGFSSEREYLDHRAREQGFENLRALELHRLKERGFSSEREYLDHRAREQGFENLRALELHRLKERGFSSEREYLEHKAREQGFESHYALLDHRAVQKGFANHIEYTNSRHPYLRYRKNYCENQDGSKLGFRCTSTILISAQLDVDHIDGDPSNNDPSNLQTLCKCCHTYKTHESKDWRSPGRKALGIKY